MKPINVLTGLDYWLDNLMCNVPEVAMCYHQNGIVQVYLPTTLAVQFLSSFIFNRTVNLIIALPDR